MTIDEQWKRVTELAGTIGDIEGAAGLMSWDEEVMMAEKGIEPRAKQLGTLARLAHEHTVDAEYGDLLANLEAALPAPAPSPTAGSSDDAASITDPGLRAAVVRKLKRDRDLAVKLPGDFVVKRAELGSRARVAWQQARANDAFTTFQPFLEQHVEMARQAADYLGYDENPYDALLSSFEAGLSQAWIADRFDALQPRLRSLVERIVAAKSTDPTREAIEKAVFRAVPADVQVAASRPLAAIVGYDYEAGRLDLSTHPFTSGSSYRDVRITTRVDENFLPSCIMSVIHEAGHGIHSQQIDPAISRLPVDYGLAVAESQSRFYENVLGRSRGFWSRHYPLLQKAAPQFADVDLDTWYRALNAVSPSLIRVEADEVTYGMHIMLRFELENALINRELAVNDLPAAWNDGMERVLGLRPPTDREGVLQDIHWSMGAIGYFPDYLLGSILSSQLWVAVQESISDAPERVAAGDMSAINAWMADRVQRHAGTMTFPEIARHATGRDFTVEPYMAYLESKYAEVYGL